MPTTKGLKATSKRGRRVTKKQPSPLIVKGRLVLEQWVSTLTSKAKTFHSQVLYRLRLIEKCLNISSQKLLKLAKIWGEIGGIALMHSVIYAGTVIFLLLLLMPLLVLFVVGHLLRLSRYVLTFIRTKLFRGTSKFATNTLTRPSKRKVSRKKK